MVGWSDSLCGHSHFFLGWLFVTLSWSCNIVTIRLALTTLYLKSYSLLPFPPCQAEHWKVSKKITLSKVHMQTLKQKLLLCTCDHFLPVNCTLAMCMSMREWQIFAFVRKSIKFLRFDRLTLKKENLLTTSNKNPENSDNLLRIFELQFLRNQWPVMCGMASSP